MRRLGEVPCAQSGDLHLLAARQLSIHGALYMPFRNSHVNRLQLSCVGEPHSLLSGSASHESITKALPAKHAAFSADGQVLTAVRRGAFA